MIGIDTNVLVRFLVRDDEAQFERARLLIEREVGLGEPVFSSQWVLLETGRVLRSRYVMAKAAIVAAFAALPAACKLQFEGEPPVVEEAVFIWKDSSAECAACLIDVHPRALGCRAQATFDAKALKLSGFVSA